MINLWREKVQEIIKMNKLKVKNIIKFDSYKITVKTCI